MARSPSRSRSRSPRRRRERDWRGDRDRERERVHERDRDRDWEMKSRGDRGRLGERGRDRDREDRGRRRERERQRESGRSGSPRHDYQRAPSDDYEGRRDVRGRGRSRDESRDILEFDKMQKKGSERREDEVMKDSEGQRAAIVAEFVDGIVREHEQLVEASMHSSPVVQASGPPAVPQPDEEDLMKKLGIPVGFSTTKGKYVSDANHSAVKLTTKRQPRQYMNRRGGFNRPLPAETNR